MIEIKRNEPSKFEFEMQISGDVTGDPGVYFNIRPITGDLSLSFKALPIENGCYEVKLPSLERYLGPGTYPCELSVVIGDHYYVPLIDECVLKDDPKPTISSFRVTSTAAAPTVSVQPKAAPQAPIPTIRPVQATESVEQKASEAAKPIIDEVKGVDPKPVDQPKTKPAPDKPVKKNKSNDEIMMDLLLKKKKSK